MEVPDALRAALTSYQIVEEEPAEPRAAARSYVARAGGTGTVARQELGYRAGLRPRDMTAPQRRAYNTTLRRIQRYITGAAERRAAPPAFVSSLRRVVRRRMVDRELIARLRRAGIAARMQGTASYTDAQGRTTTYTRTMPKPPSPGVVLGEQYPSDEAGTPAARRAARSVTDPFLAGDDEEAAEQFLTHFFDSYGAHELHVSNIVGIALWPADEGEPDMGMLGDEEEL